MVHKYYALMIQIPIINKLQLIQSKIDNSKFTSPFYFKEAIPVASFGGYVDEITTIGYFSHINIIRSGRQNTLSCIIVNWNFIEYE